MTDILSPTSMIGSTTDFVFAFIPFSYVAEGYGIEI